MKKISGLLRLLALVVFGVLPSLAFFAWIERNMALPWIGTWIGWPWVFVDLGLASWVALDIGLVAAFGLLHSALAGRVPRLAYVIIAGVSAVFVMGLWQPTGVILYQVIPSAKWASIVSFSIYWTLMAIGGRALAHVERPENFLGFTTPEKAKPTPLWTGGLYASVRHPVYTFTLAAWLITPMMSLDRVVFIFAATVYLIIGVGREERRLEDRFGESYRVYRATTPMLLPTKTFKRSR